MQKTIVTLFACLLFAGCANRSNTTQEAAEQATPDMHNAANALDVTGLYKGVFPAADCPGINITLQLNGDKTFRMHYDYMERPGNDFDDKGTYTVDTNLLKMTIEEGTTEYYRIAENSLTRLDSNMDVMEGPPTFFYILTKETK